MIKKHVNAGGPVEEILYLRSTYWCRLMCGLLITTGAVMVWATLNLVSDDKHMGHRESVRTVAYLHLPILDDNPPPLAANIKQLNQKRQYALQDTSFIDPNGDAEKNDQYEGNAGYDYQIKMDSHCSSDTTEVEPAFVEDTETLKTIHVKALYTQATVRDVLRDITLQTGIRFTYPNLLVLDNPNVTLQKDDCAVHDLLIAVLTPHDLKYAKLGSSPLVSIFQSI